VEAWSFEDFVAARGEALLRFAVVLCGDRGRAEDLVQSVLIKAYPQWDRVAAMERPEAYLRTILVHAHLRWWRRRPSREIPAVVPLDDQPTRTDIAQHLADRDAAWELLGRLPARQRAVLVLRYYEDQSDGEIARTLGCRESTVRSQAARGLASLRAIIPTIDREALP
jgi:RNA polymerase sigma-70 factor (sigma-E family)